MTSLNRSYTVGKYIRRAIVICPKCGEDNSDNFRFCGLCGTLLEARRPAGAPVPGLPKVANIPDQPVASQPSMDALREKAFSGLDSFFEPEQPKTGGRRILLMVAL